MKKDIKEIVMAEFKSQGLEIAEDVAMAAVKSAFRLLPKILVATENKLDDMLIPILGIIEPPVLELLDKIDGEKDL